MKSVKMEELFKLAGYSDFSKMEIGKVYDITDKNIKIKSFNQETQKVENTLVQGLIYKGKQKVYNLVLNDGTILLKCSETHRVFDNKEKQFYEVKEKEEFDVLTNSGKEVHCFSKSTNEVEHLLDIEVEDNESYFSNGILSHNCTGGKAIRFASSTRQRITKLETLSNGKEDAGIQIRVRNYKNKTGVPWRDAVLNLYFDGGFKVDDEYFGFLALFDIIHKGNGGVYTADFLPNGKIRGEANVKEWITAPEQKELYDKLKEQVMEKLLRKNEQDANNVKVDENGIAETDKVEVSPDDLDLMVNSEESTNPEEVGL